MCSPGGQTCIQLMNKVGVCKQVLIYLIQRDFLEKRFPDTVFGMSKFPSSCNKALQDAVSASGGSRNCSDLITHHKQQFQPY